MHKKKEDTMQRISRRKYEEKNKVERQSKSGNFQTMIPRATFEEINGFLKENNITKVQLIIEGYKALKEQQEKNGDVGKHELNEMGTLNMKEKK